MSRPILRPDPILEKIPLQVLSRWIDSYPLEVEPSDKDRAWFDALPSEQRIYWTRTGKAQYMAQHHLLPTLFLHPELTPVTEEVAAKTGVKAPLTLADLAVGEPTVMGASLQTDTGAISIMASLYFCRIFPARAVRGVMAHELGHIALRHNELSMPLIEADDRPLISTVSRQYEFEADAWAASHGYGPDLVSALRDNRDGDQAWDHDTFSHPRTLDRIDRIEKLLTQK